MPKALEAHQDSPDPVSEERERARFFIGAIKVAHLPRCLHQELIAYSGGAGTVIAVSRLNPLDFQKLVLLPDLQPVDMIDSNAECRIQAVLVSDTTPEEDRRLGNMIAS
jgi:hypothetical protein